MPAVILRRVVAATLSSVLLLGAALPAVAAPAPPAIDSALESLMTSSGPALGTAKVKLPACGVRDEMTRYSKVSQWKKTLLDTNLRLPKAYQPWDLVSVKQANVAGSGKVRKRMIKDLKALGKAARNAGKPLAIRSAWRSYDYQAALFNSYVRNNGRAQALKFSARPGHSEHQLGTTVDFTVGPGVPLSTKFGDSPSGKWHMRNGWKFGFIMSNPKRKRIATS